MQHFDSRIEDYLDGVLTRPEQLALESELANDRVLADQLALAREARERLSRIWANEPAENKLKERLQDLGAEFFNPDAMEKAHQTRQVVRLRWWMAAAAVLILAFVAIVAFPSKEQRLYTQLRHFPEADFVSKGSTDNTTLQTAGQSFNRQEYNKAFAAFESFLKEHPDHPEARLFAAFCQLELNNYPAAESEFKALHNSPFADEADWFLALTYLRQKDRDRTKAQLQEINSNSPHFQQAQQLLQAL